MVLKLQVVKVENTKKSPFKYGNRTYFRFSTLTARIFGTVQRRYVPHLKGIIRGNLELAAQGRDSTFTFHHPLLKKAILHLKTVIVRKLFCLSVRSMGF